MKTLVRALGAMVLILSGTLVNEPAMAEHRTYRHGHGHGHAPIVRFGFSYGVPIYSPRYFPVPAYSHGYAFPAPVYVYPPAVIRHYPPPVYVEQSIAPPESAPPQTRNDWHYCASSGLYYPYARDCPEGWTRVPAQPPTR